MTDLVEIAKIWNGIIEIYKETIPQNNPKVTVVAVYKNLVRQRQMKRLPQSQQLKNTMAESVQETERNCHLFRLIQIVQYGIGWLIR